ncbi:hypothetical protein H7J87_19070 [Mycolicibacterium wolinskyi]|uniref:G domain-containing protein n=1 Tax=Mycolicibacterium wolinskyi TaxID=59750 RepID=A0A1X2ETU9_9MYCO|nr:MULTISPECIES: hypothetical protein [Mycolicibacterium]MCV7287428.1 hypothetical protein [Mycolicibacterium wolinskyi]MCV7294933.1 hypothetical protein [Mycolicibacterium goodii]ORX09239.1 hypothetical protein AWC31_09860 [Mycolicibacterium wolinskyi]
MAQISARVSADVTVAVHGRRGVGVSTVAGALAGCGVAVRDSGEISVLVIAEVLKPEDRASLARLRQDGTPVLIVLNKADLAGSGPGGPMATARGRADQLRRLAGVPVVPMVALLAGADPAPHLVRALRVVAAEPADLTSPDAFLRAPHGLPVEVRVELLDALDRFGIAHAALALSRGADADGLPTLLHRLSEVDQVLAALSAVAAPVRYRRMRRALAELRALRSEPAARFLAADETVFAIMGAAVDVVEADGVAVDRGDDRKSHLHRAHYWRRYSRGPVNALHRSCGADIARGSLRLLDSSPDHRVIGR